MAWLGVELPGGEWPEAIRALEDLGFRVDRVEGSHHMMVKEGHPRTVPVPVHVSKTLPKGTLASIIRMAEATRQQFLKKLALVHDGLALAGGELAQRGGDGPGQLRGYGGEPKRSSLYSGAGARRGPTFIATSGRE